MWRTTASSPDPGTGRPPRHPPWQDLLRKLKMRFVEGEITEEEYLRIKRLLE